MCACVSACVRACVCVSACACVCVCVCHQLPKGGGGGGGVSLCLPVKLLPLGCVGPSPTGLVTDVTVLVPIQLKKH